MADKYRILSLDGGGIRGVLTARLLERIAEVRPEFLGRVDLFAGTSTGSILAIGLAMGLTPTRLVALYREQGPLIFRDSAWDDVRDLWGLNGAQYSTRNRLEGIVLAVKKDTVMAQVELACGPYRIVSLMSREAADELGLKPGDTATAVVKATTVVVESSG